jgi:hypothetical protein
MVCPERYTLLTDRVWGIEYIFKLYTLTGFHIYSFEPSTGLLNVLEP